MKLEQQVVSLELAKKLKELGCKQESVYVWFYYGGDDFGTKDSSDGWKLLANWQEEDPEDLGHTFSAFTVAELGEMLPDKIISSREGVLWTTEKLENRCWYEDGGDYPQKQPYGEATNEADARAKMLCYLLENRLI